MEMLVDSKGLHVYDPRSGRRYYIDGFIATETVFGTMVSLSVSNLI